MDRVPTGTAAEDRKRRHRVGNALHSLALLGAMILLAATTGWVLAGPTGALWAVAAGALSLLFAPRMSPRMVLGLYGTRRLVVADSPNLFAVVRAVAARAGLASTPELYWIASPTLNAFAVGTPDRAAIAVTDGLLRALTLRELAGVLAHEMSHIRNNDLFVMGLADTIASLTRFMSAFGIALLLLNLPLVMMEAEPLPWSAVLLLTFAPSVGALLQLALSRTREYDADLDAAHLTGDPEGLASALGRIERIQAGPWEGLFGRRQRMDTAPSLLRTHPRTQDRIRRLLDLRTPPPVLPGLHQRPLHLPFAAATHRPRLRLGGYRY